MINIQKIIFLRVEDYMSRNTEAMFKTWKNADRVPRVPRLSDTRYSAKGTKGWRYASSKAKLESATYPRSQYMVMCGGRQI